MIERSSASNVGARNSYFIAGVCAVATLATACGGSSVRSGVAVGGLGSSLGLHLDAAPHSAEVCLLKDSLLPSNGGIDKPLTDNCAKAQKNDLLMRRALQTLSLYGQRLGAAASGEDAETAGKLEAATAGVNGTEWSDAEDQTARDAVSQLVTQMGAPTQGSKVDLNKIVLDAAPPVKSLCTSFTAYIDGQIKDLAAIRQDVDKKSQSRQIRRCGTYETHSICVADTVVDRMVYAEIFARAASLENESYDAKDNASRFCAAHDRLAEAAQKDQLSKKETYAAVVEAVKAVPREQAHWDNAGTSSASDPTKPATPSTATAKSPAASTPAKLPGAKK